MKLLLSLLVAFIVAPFKRAGVAYMERENFGLRSIRAPRSKTGLLPVGVFSDGSYNDRPADHCFGIAPGLLDPNRWHIYENDFDQFIAADWVITETQAGATQGLAAGDGGLLALVNSAADDDLNAIQKTPAGFLMEAGKPAVWGCRFKVSDATQSDLVVGLQIVDATPLAVSDGIWFQKDDDDTQLDFHVAKGAAQTDVNNIVLLANDTFLSVEWIYDGETSIFYGVNGVIRGFVPFTNLPNTQDVTVSLAVQNGDANARTLTVDYAMAAKYRG